MPKFIGRLLTGTSLIVILSVGGLAVLLALEILSIPPFLAAILGGGIALGIASLLAGEAAWKD